jgi:hypothetical protein
VFVWAVRPKYQNHVFDHGFHDGYFCGQEDIFEQIAAEFGWEYDPGYRALFKVGRGEAVVVEQNGVKTPRIHFPERPNQPLEPTGDRRETSPTTSSTSNPQARRDVVASGSAPSR